MGRLPYRGGVRISVSAARSPGDAFKERLQSAGKGSEGRVSMRSSLGTTSASPSRTAVRACCRWVDGRSRAAERCRRSREAERSGLVDRDAHRPREVVANVWKPSSAGRGTPTCRPPAPTALFTREATGQSETFRRPPPIWLLTSSRARHSAIPGICERIRGPRSRSTACRSPQSRRRISSSSASSATQARAFASRQSVGRSL